MNFRFVKKLELHLFGKFFQSLACRQIYSPNETLNDVLLYAKWNRISYFWYFFHNEIIYHLKKWNFRKEIIFIFECKRHFLTSQRNELSTTERHTSELKFVNAQTWILTFKIRWKSMAYEWVRSMGRSNHIYDNLNTKISLWGYEWKCILFFTAYMDNNEIIFCDEDNNNLKGSARKTNIDAF